MGQTIVPCGVGRFRRSTVVAVTLSLVLVAMLFTSGLVAAGAEPLSQAASRSCSGTFLSPSVVGMAASRDDRGYWIVNSAGSVVSCGDAPNLGGLTVRPTHPIVGIAATSDGRGYYLVGSDGGDFTFGSANFEGRLVR